MIRNIKANKKKRTKKINFSFRVLFSLIRSFFSTFVQFTLDLLETVLSGENQNKMANFEKEDIRLQAIPVIYVRGNHYDVGFAVVNSYDL